MTHFTPAFAASAPRLSLLRSISLCRAPQICQRGEFVKRVRHATISHATGDAARVPRDAAAAAPGRQSTRQVPTASLLASVTQVASTGAGIFLLGFIIFVHESGHFLAARLQGIRVKNFSIGFGPQIFNFSPAKSETEFTVRLLPLGGYVAFPEHATIDEETGETVVSDDPDLLQNRPLFDRALVISAGVIANVILAWGCIFASVSTVGLPTYNFSPGVNIANIVDTQGTGAKAGVKAGDVILRVDGNEVPKSLDSARVVAEKIRTSGGREMDFRILRGGKEFDMQIRAKCCTPEGNAAMGVQLIPNADVTRVRPPTVLKSVETTNKEFSRLSRQTWNGLTSIVSNFQKSSQNLSGPIGVVSMGADLARNDTAALLTFCAVISINLALINSLPLPALDGGQMTFLLIEALRGAPVSLRVQDAINRTALLLFLAFSGVLVFGDLEKLNILSAIQKLFG